MAKALAKPTEWYRSWRFYIVAKGSSGAERHEIGLWSIESLRGGRLRISRGLRRDGERLNDFFKKTDGHFLIVLPFNPDLGSEAIEYLVGYERAEYLPLRLLAAADFCDPEYGRKLDQPYALEAVVFESCTYHRDLYSNDRPTCEGKQADS